MSWDFGMMVDVGNGNRKYLEMEPLNYTYNVYSMYKDSLSNEVGIRFIHGEKAKDVIEQLRNARDIMESNPEKYQKMNPENGWGNYEGALKVLNTLIQWGIECPEAYYDVW